MLDISKIFLFFCEQNFYNIFFIIPQVFKNWEKVGTYGFEPPGIISKKNYENADVWALLITLYLLVENILIFKTSEETRKGFVLQGRRGTFSFKRFISTMLNDIFDETFTHQKLMNNPWMRH